MFRVVSRRGVSQPTTSSRFPHQLEAPRRQDPSDRVGSPPFQPTVLGCGPTASNLSSSRKPPPPRSPIISAGWWAPCRNQQDLPSFQFCLFSLPTSDLNGGSSPAAHDAAQFDRTVDGQKHGVRWRDDCKLWTVTEGQKGRRPLRLALRTHQIPGQPALSIVAGVLRGGGDARPCQQRPRRRRDPMLAFVASPLAIQTQRARNRL